MHGSASAQRAPLQCRSETGDNTKNPCRIRLFCNLYRGTLAEDQGGRGLNLQRGAPSLAQDTSEVEGLMRWLLTAACAWGLTSGALADATLVVELRAKGGKPADGTVALLRDGDSVERGCTTQHGRCEIRDVPGGAYRVGVSRDKKAVAKPKDVMIPPEGEVKLIVAVDS